MNSVRSSYDAVAADYATLLSGELEGKPLDRAMLAAFAECVRGDGPGAGRSRTWAADRAG